MTRRLVGTYLLIAVTVIAMLAIPLGMLTATRERERLVANVERDAVVIANLVEEALEDGADAVDPGIDDYLATSGARVVITDRSGVSVFDPSNPDVRRDYSTRPEVADALQGRRAVGTRHSDTLDTDLLFVAVPVSSNRVVHGAVRLTFDTSEVEARVRSVWGVLVGLALVTASLTALVGLWIARWVAAPIRQLGQAVSDFSAGDTAARSPVDAGPPEVRDLAARFNRMAARLSELLDSQQQFVATASHQLRSPLQALRLELETAQLPGDAEREGAVERAISETRRLGRVVDGLLAIARTDGATGDVVDLDLAELVRDRVEHWSSLADEQGVVLRTTVEPGQRARAVDGHAEQVLDNLIANALDAQPDGGRITITSTRTPGGVEIVVIDEGPGLGEEERDLAFQRFWRRSTADGGSGLGLPIARQLARASGGEVRLEADEGGGVRAVITLPTAG